MIFFYPLTQIIIPHEYIAKIDNVIINNYNHYSIKLYSKPNQLYFMKYPIKYIYLLLLPFALTSCNSDEPKQNIEPAKSIEITDNEFIAGYKNFEYSIKLLNTLSASESGNVIISPINIMRNNGIFINGTTNDTQKEILTALNFDGTVDDYNSYISKVFGELKTIDPLSAINYGSALWIDESKKLDLQSDFTKTMKEKYNADIFNVYRLYTEDAKNAINNWIWNTTNNQIPGVLKENLPESIKMFEASTLYFKGLWKDPFDRKKTVAEQFNNYDGSISDVWMMKGDMKYVGIVTDNYSAVKMPMGNKAFEMIVILPKKGALIDECSKDLTSKEFRRFLYGSETSLVHISLPKFDIYRKSDLKEAFIANGITRLFDKSQAQFNIFEVKENNNGTSNDMCVGDMSQYVQLKINEEGCESATVIHSGTIGADMPQAPKEFTLTVDRPFLLMVKEKSTPCPLILAAIKNLSK